MGTAGLDIKMLAGLLERMKATFALIDDDRVLDHCVFGVSSVKCSGLVAYIEYENIGEPRLAGMIVRPEGFILTADHFPLEWEKEITIKGSRQEDPKRIARWIEQEFLAARQRQTCGKEST